MTIATLPGRVADGATTGVTPMAPPVAGARIALTAGHGAGLADALAPGLSQNAQ